jgi:hypothetical protein
MHRVSLYTHFFFVPNRLLWDNWEDFITGGEDGQDTSVFPFINANSHPGSLSDYLGVPSSNEEDVPVSAIPFSGYALIYNEYYRDQNLIEPIPYKLDDGDNDDKWDDLSNIKRRAWQHDYFTSALPWTQKGPEATLPLGTEAPILFDLPNSNIADTVTKADGSGFDLLTSFYGDGFGHLYASGNDPDQQVSIDNSKSLKADLSQATAATINDLRTAFKLQEWLEKNARGGSRYVESILSHFGVKSSDARLQRPEFLGGGSAPVVISEVLQTSDNSSDTTPQGNMAGHGISVGASNSVSKYVEEHGYIIGLMTVMPKSAYQQGIPKHFKKFNKFDYGWPSFAHLGEQPIYNYELYSDPNDDADDEIFGYIPRYAEYKYAPDTVHGEFKTTLDFWHMGRKFANRPKLNRDFIEMNSNEVNRIFAVSEAEQLYVHMFHKIKAKRKLPYFGTPRI